MALMRDLIEAVRPLFPHATFTPDFAPPIPMMIASHHVETPEEIEMRKKETSEVDAFISKMEPEIKTQTEALIKEEIREMLLMGGNRPRILELLRAGKTPKIIRKKEGRRDPLFLQFGDGIADPIEETRILG